MKRLFITGTMRSGTTLVEKLISSHRDATILSQPFPLLLVEIKRQFLAGIGHDPGAYPLGDRFRDTRYRREEWHQFLLSLRLGREELLAALLPSTEYSGQYTRFRDEELRAVVTGTLPAEFIPTVAYLWERLSGSSALRVCGAKEISCEEYLPVMEEQGIESLLVLRDPRDIVASLTTGRATEYAGRARPLLFTIRQWRKSVACSLESGPNRHTVRYEDVVVDPLRTLAACLDACGLSTDLLDPANLRDPLGEPWTGNSSYGDRKGIDSSSNGAYERVLPRAVSRFVEATCLPELRRVGYRTTLTVAEAVDAIRDFKEPYPLERPELGSLRGGTALDEEIERLGRLLVTSTGRDDDTTWFLSPVVAEALRDTL